MQKILLFIVFALFSQQAIAQSCSPDPNITAPGIYPDTSDNLPQGYKNVYYEGSIQVNTIDDTTLSVGYVKVDYGEMKSITGLPPGISYVCNPLTCRINGGNMGCILFYGTCTTPGTYNLTVTVKISGKLWGIIPYSQNQVVTGYRIVINDTPQAAFTSNVTNVCPGGTVKYYEAAAGAPTSWHWSFPGGDPASSTAKKPIVKYYNSGSYNVVLQVSSPAGTHTYIKQNYVEVGGVTANISINGNDSICSGGSTDLEATGGNNLDYQWYRNAVSLPGANAQTYTAVQGGNYTVSITDLQTGCVSKSAKTKITVSYPTASIIAVDPVQFCNGQTCELKASHVNGQTYQWLRKGVPIAGATQKQYVANLGGNYKCFVTNKLGCTAYSNAITLSIVCREQESANEFSIVQNPVIDFLMVKINESSGQLFEFDIYNTSGQLIQSLGRHYFAEGINSISFPADQFSSGLYILRIAGIDVETNLKFGVSSVK